MRNESVLSKLKEIEERQAAINALLSLVINEVSASSIKDIDSAIEDTPNTTYRASSEEVLAECLQYIKNNGKDKGDTVYVRSKDLIRDISSSNKLKPSQLRLVLESSTLIQYGLQYEKETSSQIRAYYIKTKAMSEAIAQDIAKKYAEELKHTLYPIFIKQGLEHISKDRIMPFEKIDPYVKEITGANSHNQCASLLAPLHIGTIEYNGIMVYFIAPQYLEEYKQNDNLL